MRKVTLRVALAMLSLGMLVGCQGTLRPDAQAKHQPLKQETPQPTTVPAAHAPSQAVTSPASQAVASPGNDAFVSPARQAVAAAISQPSTQAATQASSEPAIPAHTQIQDVIYGRKYGTCLTMDVFMPEHPNGAGIIALDTGGWMIDHDHIWAGGYITYLQRGYTVFVVIHGSAPKFSALEQVYDVQRAIKFIRYHAAEYKIDPDRLGITGASAGGHLSLMMGLTDSADPQALDPVEKMSSRVQAVGCFCPPTDLTNRLSTTRPTTSSAPASGPASSSSPATGPSTRPRGNGSVIVGAFTFMDFVEKPRWRHLMGSGNPPGVSPGAVRIISDPEKNLEILRSISPIKLITASAAPMMIIQGEMDKSVPPEGTRQFVAKLDEAGIPNKLTLVPGAGHRIPDAEARTADLADWFDTYLGPKK